MASRSSVKSVLATQPASAARLSCPSVASTCLFRALRHPAAESKSQQRRPQQVSYSARLFSTTSVKPAAQGSDDKYKSRSVQELLSLKGKTTVITGGGRGIGLALTRACVEAGGNVAVLDALPEPHEDFADVKNDFTASKIEYYKYVSSAYQTNHSQI
jgi:hypothetical protein